MRRPRSSLPPTWVRTGSARQLLANVCYPGQNFDLPVPVPDGDDDTVLAVIAERFHDLHEADRGYAFRDQEPLLRSLRYVAVGETPKPSKLAPLGSVTDPQEALKGRRSAFFGDGYVETPVFDGPRLAPGVNLDGPALIEEPFTVVVVAPGQRVTVDAHGNYDLHIA
jgi:N-methylhydantoinase A